MYIDTDWHACPKTINDTFFPTHLWDATFQNSESNRDRQLHTTWCLFYLNYLDFCYSCSIHIHIYISSALQHTHSITKWSFCKEQNIFFKRIAQDFFFTKTSMITQVFSLPFDHFPISLIRIISCLLFYGHPFMLYTQDWDWSIPILFGLAPLKNI